MLGIEKGFVEGWLVGMAVGFDVGSDVEGSNVEGALDGGAKNSCLAILIVKTNGNNWQPSALDAFLKLL